MQLYSDNFYIHPEVENICDHLWRSYKHCIREQTRDTNNTNTKNYNCEYKLYLIKKICPNINIENYNMKSVQ